MKCIVELFGDDHRRQPGHVVIISHKEHMGFVAFVHFVA